MLGLVVLSSGLVVSDAYAFWPIELIIIIVKQQSEMAAALFCEIKDSVIQTDIGTQKGLLHKVLNKHFMQQPPLVVYYFELSIHKG